MQSGQREGWLQRWFHLRGPEARIMQVLLILGGLGLLLLDVGKLFGSGPAAPPGPPPPGAAAVTATPAAPAAGELATHEERLAGELVRILSAVRGSGRVEVTVRLAAGPSRVLAMEHRQVTRTVEEQDTAGGTRVTADGEEQSVPVLVRQDRSDQPVTVREEAPAVAGVVVVAEGAVNDRVREQLYLTAAAALGIPMSRIVVMPMGGTWGG